MGESQGRYIDIPLSVTNSEQIELLSRAIVSHRTPATHRDLAQTVGNLLRQYRPDVSRKVESYLQKCWPLHPVTACLLGATSRRRFGQNQRSLFGFLNSHEPAGFQDFLSGAAGDDLFTPDMLFDYLRANWSLRFWRLRTAIDGRSRLNPWNGPRSERPRKST